MIPHLKFWCSFLFIINFCDSVFSLIKKEYEIHDLVSTDATTFAADVSAWEVEGNLTATLYTTCGSTLLLGGDGVLQKFAFFKRTYTELETHNGISGQIAFWLIDNWRTNDDLIMLRIFDEVSTNIFYQRVLTVAYSASWGSSACGSSSYGDLQTAKLNFRFPHSGPNITFQIYTTHPMDTNPVSYGIRDVRIMLHKDAPGLSVCTLPGSIFMSDRCTSCADNQYNLGLGCASCGTYDDACVNSASNPYVCKSSATLFAQDPTHCYCAPCDSTCLTCSVANSDVSCLTCQPGLYLFSNGTCLPSCPYTITPLNGINYCDFTCLSLTATEYLYPNNTCMTSCDPPYAIVDVSVGKLCNFPCAPSGFAYPNNQCRSSCPLPMRTYIEPLNIQYCRVPCDYNLYYYPEDGSCRATCPYPHAIKENEFYYECDVGSASAVAFAALTSSMNGDAAEVVNKGTLAASFIFVGQSWGIFVAAYTRLFQNIRYVNASYATHTELLVKNWNNSLMTLEFFPSMPQSLQKKVPENPTVAMFELYGVQSSFIVSCWRAFMSILSVLTVFILLWFIEWMTLRTGSKNAILKFLRILAQNSFLITLYGNFGYIVMYAILEYRSLNFNNTNGLSILSFILALTFLMAVLVSLVLSFLFLRKRGKLIQKAEWTENYGPLKAFTKENTGFQVLFIDFKEKYQSFLFTFMLRDIVCNLVVGVLTNFPLMQAGVLSVCNIMWFFYIYSNRPFRRILDQIQFTFYEVLLLFANGSALVATVLDDVEDVDDSLREILAKIIMFTTMIYSYSVFVFFGLKGANMIYDIYKIRKALKNPLVDKEELAQEQGFLGDMLGLDGENLNQDITNQDKDSSFIANDSKLESNSLIKSEKSRPLRSKKPALETSTGIIDEYYRKKELVMDSNNLRVHVGRFGKGKGEKDLDGRIQRRPRKGSFDDFKGDGRKKLSDLVPKPEKVEKPSYKMPETELRCREKQDLDDKIRKEQTSNNLSDYKYAGFYK